jgi:hypothetical protein
MRTSSIQPDRPPLERSKAWSYLITNLFVLPGLGSIMAKRFLAGGLQIALSLLGFLVTLVALIRMALAWAQQFMLPDDPSLYYTAMAGIGIFIVGWVWSLITSLLVLRSSQDTPKPPKTAV